MPKYVGMDSERHLGGRPKPRQHPAKSPDSVGASCFRPIHESRSGTGTSCSSRPAPRRTKGAHCSPELNSTEHAIRGPSLAGGEVNAPGARRKSPHIPEALRGDPRSVEAPAVRVSGLVPPEALFRRWQYGLNKVLPDDDLLSEAYQAFHHSQQLRKKF